MYDNYGVTGKTISQQTSLLDQEQNPLISVNVPTTNPTSQAITTSTTIQPLHSHDRDHDNSPFTSDNASWYSKLLCCSNNFTSA